MYKGGKNAIPVQWRRGAHGSLLGYKAIAQLWQDAHLWTALWECSRVPDTVERLYVDLYLAVSFMYISRARKALSNSSAKPPHPLHFLLHSFSLALLLALAVCSSLIAVCLYPPLITVNCFQSRKSSVPGTLTDRLVRRIIQLYKLELIQVAVVTHPLARFGSCWQDWTYLGDDQYNSGTGYYTMVTIEYCDSLPHGHLLPYTSLLQGQMEFKQVKQARILLCIITLCPKYTWSHQSHSCIKLTTSKCWNFLTLSHILQLLYGLP